jgi:enoyl-CoA hydratase
VELNQEDKMNIASLFERRSLLKAAAALGGLSALLGRAVVAHADGQSGDAGIEGSSDQVKMADIPRSSATKVTVERRGQIVLIGINRPYIHNRVDPETYNGLARAFYQYDHDPSLRAAVLFGHGRDRDTARATLGQGLAVSAFPRYVPV